MIEVTETAVIRNEAAASTFLAQMRALGCRIALDDFGTGYGGFRHLKTLPVDILKIDVDFVRDLPTSRASRHVVEAVVSLARAFGQRTIAEGVENHETLVSSPASASTSPRATSSAAPVPCTTRWGWPGPDAPRPAAQPSGSQASVRGPPRPWTGSVSGSGTAAMLASTSSRSAGSPRRRSHHMPPG